MDFNIYHRDMELKVETARFKQWAINSQNPHTGDVHTSKLVAAFFKDLDREYLPYRRQKETVYFDTYATWWEQLKDSLPKWCRLDWVDPGLKFGWIQSMNTGRTQMMRNERTVEYTTQITLRSYIVHVTDSHAGRIISRTSFDNLRISPHLWYEVQSD